MNFQAVLFDCDGVLVDSEPITARVLRDCLEASGWPLTLQECCNIFIGKAVRDERARIERETGRPLTEEWMQWFYQLRNTQLQQHLLPIAGALAAVTQVHEQFGGCIACASGADRYKLNLQLAKVGMQHLFGHRLFSGQELPRNKPAPDVYLAAAAALGVDPQHCIVVEDSPTGIAAGAAAGAAVIAFAPPAGLHPAQHLLQAGACATISHMADLPQAIARLAA